MGLLVEGTDYEIVGVESTGVVNHIHIRTINTVDDADTIAVVLSTYGISATGLRSVDAWEHTTDDSVMVRAEATTAVSSGTLTITIGGSNDNNPRYVEVVGFATPNPGTTL